MHVEVFMYCAQHMNNFAVIFFISPVSYSTPHVVKTDIPGEVGRPSSNWPPKLHEDPIWTLNIVNKIRKTLITSLSSWLLCKCAYVSIDTLSSTHLGVLGGLLTGVRAVHGIVLLHLHRLHLLLDGVHAAPAVPCLVERLASGALNIELTLIWIDSLIPCSVNRHRFDSIPWSLTQLTDRFDSILWSLAQLTDIGLIRFPDPLLSCQTWV